MMIPNGGNEVMQSLINDALSMLNDAIADNDRFRERMAQVHYEHVMMVNNKVIAINMQEVR